MLENVLLERNVTIAHHYNNLIAHQSNNLNKSTLKLHKQINAFLAYQCSKTTSNLIPNYKETSFLKNQ